MARSSATWQLAHNVWDPKAGCSKTEVIRNLGREDELDRKSLERLVENVSRYLGEEIQTTACLLSKTRTSPLNPGRSFGGVWALDQMWRRMNIDKILKHLLKKRQFETPVERVIFAMVANRALAPSSKLAIEEWVDEDAFIPDLASCPGPAALPGDGLSAGSRQRDPGGCLLQRGQPVQPGSRSYCTSIPPPPTSRRKKRMISGRSATPRTTARTCPRR